MLGRVLRPHPGLLMLELRRLELLLLELQRILLLLLLWPLLKLLLLVLLPGEVLLHAGRLAGWSPHHHAGVASPSPRAHVRLPHSVLLS